MGCSQSGDWTWDIKVAADDLLGEPLATVETFELIELLSSVKPNGAVTDIVKWRHNYDGVFSVKASTI